MTIYCTFLWNKQISLEWDIDCNKELYDWNNPIWFVITYHWKNIFIWSFASDFNNQIIDLAFIDIENQTIEESILLATKLKAKTVVPIGRKPGYEWQQVAIEFSSIIMLHKLWVPKLLMPWQYVLL
jgi:hypothetical protein